MKKRKAEILAAIIFGFLIPVLILSKVPTNKENLVHQPNGFTQEQITQKAVKIPVLMRSGSTVMMDLDKYLIGVVLAEMPAAFEEEALKAQAVVARTYTMKRIQAANKHDGAICTQPSCCQAYCSVEEYLDKGNTQSNLNKVKKAVESTSAKVLLYNGEYIEATYFSCSGGRTEGAVAVWGTEVPYLQSVESPGEEIAAHYTDTATFTVKEFLSKLNISGALKIGKITYTDGGGVYTIEICGRTFTGTSVRQMLGLRSTAFQISVLGDTVKITTKGYGHRVGMSQYGAQAMALDGKRYQEILGYYYQGTNISNIGGN